VYDVLETVDGSDLALAALVGASDNQNLVVFSDWDGADLEIVRCGRGGWHSSYERCISRGAPC
jgi:hypothetical protein